MIIRCNNINKTYDKNKVIDNFNYEFSENKLYALYGVSGVGKTTILNIITGIIPFEGIIDIYDESFKNKVNENYAMKKIAYITQEDYCIEYLNIYDNLKLCSTRKNEKNIVPLLKKFNLNNIEKKYPKELSGGELQRISIIMAILQDKEIIILDEPTSSLDKENAEYLINILLKLKKNHLIICATHDKNLISVADEKIEIGNQYTFNKTQRKKDTITIKQTKKRSLIKYMMKEFINKKSEKKPVFFLIFIFLIIFLTFNMCYDYEEKIEKSILSRNNINFVDYNCYKEEDPFCDNIIKDYNGIANIFLYNGNLPVPQENRIYEGTSKTLPFSKELLPNYQSYLAYGSYYEEEKDIILGSELAEKLSPNVENLIGTYYEVNLPDGVENFRIVGILKNIENDIYMTTMHGNHSINREIYLNDLYISKYKNDGVDKFNKVEQGFYMMRAYFSNTNDLKKFYDDNQYKLENWTEKGPKSGIVVQKYESNFIDFKWAILAMDYYLKPGIIVGFFVTILFYFEYVRIKNKYKGYILSIYRYYGYSWAKIIKDAVVTQLIFLTFLYFCSFLLMLILNPILNNLLIKLNIINFTLFLTDFHNIFLLYIYLFFISLFLSIIISILQIKKGWLNVIKEGDNII